MPWNGIKLNDGHTIPSIAFGTWTSGNGQGTIDQIDQAISIGFNHVDTAQLYRNEAEVGVAIRESGLARNDIFITTKYSGLDGLDIPAALNNSLEKLGVSYIDLYLIHNSRIALPDIPTAWKQMEQLREQGLVKSIGISNFGVPELKILLASAKVKPAAHQIMLHPYVYPKHRPIIELGVKHGIVTEAYSSLIPITQLPGGPLDKPLNAIARRLGATSDQVLLAWVKAKGAVAITTSSKKYRLEGYLHAGDLVLTPEDIYELDKAGAEGSWPPWQLTTGRVAKRLIAVMLMGAVVFSLTNYIGLGFLKL